MEAKHTPGPWEAGEEYDGQYPVSATIDGNKYCVAALIRSKHDAHLIAAAPELLKALQEADRLYSTMVLVANAPGAGEWINAVRDAIAKATGAAS